MLLVCSVRLEQSVQSEEDRKTLQQLDRALWGRKYVVCPAGYCPSEGGTIQPNRQAYPLHDLLSDLELQFKSIAAQRNIQFKVHDAQFWIDTDHSGFDVLFRTLSVMPYAILPKAKWWWVYCVQRKTNIFELGMGYRTRYCRRTTD
jgi:hypothetical protein